jgi:hypothetical protein
MEREDIVDALRAGKAQIEYRKGSPDIFWCGNERAVEVLQELAIIGDVLPEGGYMIPDTGKLMTDFGEAVKRKKAKPAQKMDPTQEVPRAPLTDADVIQALRDVNARLVTYDPGFGKYYTVLLVDEERPELARPLGDRFMRRRLSPELPVFGNGFQLHDYALAGFREQYGAGVQELDEGRPSEHTRIKEFLLSTDQRQR